MSAMLRRVGFTVYHIFEVYPGTQHETVSDPEWIKRCGQEGWVAISGDKRLETVPENRQAIIDAKAKVFILTDSNSPPEMWAAAVIVGHYRMGEIIQANDGPFFVNISKRSDGHVARLRLPPGYEPPLELKPQGTEQHEQHASETDLKLVSPANPSNTPWGGVAPTNLPRMKRL